MKSLALHTHGCPRASLRDWSSSCLVYVIFVQCFDLAVVRVWSLFCLWLIDMYRVMPAGKFWSCLVVWPHAILEILSTQLRLVSSLLLGILILFFCQTGYWSLKTGFKQITVLTGLHTNLLLYKANYFVLYLLYLYLIPMRFEGCRIWCVVVMLQMLKSNNIRCSIIGLSASVYICQRICQDTQGNTTGVFARRTILIML